MIERRREARPLGDRLRRLNGFGALSDTQIEALRERLEIRHAPAGKVIIPLGATDDTVLYLLFGEVQLRAEDGFVKSISYVMPAAQAPISRLRPSCYEVRATTRVEYLLIENALLDELTALDDGPVPVTYEVREHFALQAQSLESRLLIRVYEDLSTRRLRIPCVPDVSVRVGSAIARGDHGASGVGNWLLLDPVLALKVMKYGNNFVANYTRPRALPETVARIGIDATRDLIVRSVLLEQSHDMAPEFVAAYRRWWRRSVQVSALCREMAHASERFDPDFAALAGLLQGLGEGVAICYAARSQDGQMDMASLERIIRHAGREIGQAVLTMWGLPRALVNCASEAGNWGRQSTGKADYADLVLLAQLQVAREGDDCDADLPEITRVPAFRKIGLGGKTIDPMITETARLAVTEAEALVESG